MTSRSAPIALFDNYWAPTLAFAASLGARGVPLHVYGRGAVRASRYCSKRLACPPLERADEFLPWLRGQVIEGAITRVAPTTDLIAYYLSALREHFPTEVQRTIPPLAETEDCLIKTRFGRACRAAGQTVPPTAAPDDLEQAVRDAERIGYPILLKPKSHLAVGTDYRGCLVADERALRAAFGQLPIASGQSALAERYPELRWPLLQRYVSSARERVYSVSGFKDADAGILASTVTCKREQWPPNVGVSIRQQSCRDERIRQAGLKTVDRLVSRGIFELEMLVDGDELLAIDLNPRGFGFMMLDIALGADLPGLWYESTLRVPTAKPVHYAGESVEARFPIPYYAARLVGWLTGHRSGGHDSRDASKSVRWVSMLGGWADPVPTMLINMRLLRHPRSLVRPHFGAARRAAGANDPACKPAVEAEVAARGGRYRD